jgi:hypothetical protein
MMNNFSPSNHNFPSRGTFNVPEIHITFPIILMRIGQVTLDFMTSVISAPILPQSAEFRGAAEQLDPV